MRADAAEYRNCAPTARRLRTHCNTGMLREYAGAATELTDIDQREKMEPRKEEMQRRHDDDELSIWIVYEDPPDFPNLYVARRHRGYIETGEYVTGNTLIDVRAKLPPGLMRIERSASDDPMIRESWI